MRRHCDIVGLRHRRYPPAFRYAAGMTQIRLDDVDAACLQERLEVPSAEQPLAERDGIVV
jgi:hypothetical protein